MVLFLPPVKFFRLLEAFGRKNSVGRHQDGSSWSTTEDNEHDAGGSAHSVDVTSSGSSQAAMVEDPSPQRLRVSRPHMPSGTKRTWLILLSMIGAFFLCFWLIRHFYDLDANEPTEPNPTHPEFIRYGAVETNEVQELLEDEASL
ncbi:hypothetical protein MRX96_018974 [Rhipicephalus microplus]